MSGDKIEKAQARPRSPPYGAWLQPEDLVSVVVYDHEVETLVPAQPAKPTSNGSKSRIRDIKLARQHGPVSAASARARPRCASNAEGKYIHRIVLLSDGLANVGPASPDDLGRLGASLMKEHISVSTIGLGQDYNEDLMTKLSGQSDGNSYFVETSDDLTHHLRQAELGDVLSVVASEVSVEVELRRRGPPGARDRPRRDHRMNGNRVELTLEPALRRPGEVRAGRGRGARVGCQG
jgi:Ca-activated chloride channel family protein